MAAALKSPEKIAERAIDLSVKIAELTKDLEKYKEQLREFANGNTLELVVDGKGKVNVTRPRSGSESVVLEFNKDKLEKFPELRAKLLEKGVCEEKVKKVSPAAASVNIKANV